MDLVDELLEEVDAEVRLDVDNLDDDEVVPVDKEVLVVVERLVERDVESDLVLVEARVDVGVDDGFAVLRPRANRAPGAGFLPPLTRTGKLPGGVG